jgi:hypothetical protein
MRRTLLSGVTLLLSTALSIGGAELVLRASGRTPARDLPGRLPRPPIHQPDPLLGWQNKPGAFVWPGSGKDIRLTFWNSGRRATGLADRNGRPAAVILGCSFTQGWAVSDEETYPWKLQEMFPELRVVNLGTAGYGTYQSLLALQRYLAENTVPPRLVVYGFADFHETRNVASGAWLRSVIATSDMFQVKVPFASLGSDGALIRNPPEAPRAWPLRGRLASVAFLEAQYADFRTAERTRARRQVMEALLVELDRRVRNRSARLLVAVLAEFQAAATRQYISFMERQGISSVDCRHPKFFDKRMKVPGYGHPNAAMNAHWASCIGTAMRRLDLTGPVEQTPTR